MTVQMVRMLAKELASAEFEAENHTDRYRKVWGSVRNYAARNWPSYVEDARRVLTDMLTRKDVPENQKAMIHRNLVEDHRRSMDAKSAKPGIGGLKLRQDQPGQMEQFLFHRDH